MNNKKLTPHFNLSEFVINPSESIPPRIIEKIVKNFAEPLEKVRKALNMPIVVSENSCYRSHAWNVAHGRNYYSEHEFDGKGAIDIVKNDTLIEYLYKNCVFPRLILYKGKNIVHCDYREVKGLECAVYLMEKDEKSMSLIWSVKK